MISRIPVREEGKKMTCALCTDCREQLQDGRVTGRCIYGGPYAGFELRPGAREPEPVNGKPRSAPPASGA